MRFHSPGAASARRSPRRKSSRSSRLSPACRRSISCGCISSSSQVRVPIWRPFWLPPAIHRIRDVEHGEPLRALLQVLERELSTLRGDIDALYDDWFIETCAEWVVPYIGDLVGVRGLLP